MDKNISVIRLDLSHKSQILEIIKERELKQGRSVWKYDDEILNKYLDSSKFPVLFGALQNNKLLSVLGLFKWDNLPYASLTYQLHKIGNKWFKQFTNHGFCFQKAIKYGEQNNIIAYYFFQKKRTSILRRKKWPIPKNYFEYEEIIIPKNTCPKELAYWNMMDNEVKPFTGEIRRIMLKPQFLNNIYWPKD